MFWSKSASVVPSQTMLYAGEGPTHQTVIRTMRRLWLESHRSIIGTTSIILLIISSRSMPSQTDQNRRKRSICVIRQSLKFPFTISMLNTQRTIMLLQLHLLSNPIINLLILLLTTSHPSLSLGNSYRSTGVRTEFFSGFAGCPAGIEEYISGTEGCDTYTEEEEWSVGLSGWGGRRLDW